jgi:hypothetical protein
LANDRFEISKDLKIEVRRPTPGSFVLNFSKLNGTDVLRATKTVTWERIESEVFNLSLDQGLNFQDAYYAPIAASGTIELKTVENNPDLNKLIYIGLPVKISYRYRPDTLPNYWRVLFRGSVLNSIVTYIPGESYPNLTLTLTDNLDRLLNTQLSVNYPAQTANARVNQINTTLGIAGFTGFILWNTIIDAAYLQAREGVFTVAQLVNEILQLYKGGTQVSYNESTDEQQLGLFQKSQFEDPSYGFTLTNNAAENEDELTYSEITSSFDNGFIFNQVVIETLAGVVQTNLTNFGSINLHGLQSLKTVLPTDDTALIGEWATDLIQDQRYKVFTGIRVSGLDTDKKVNKLVDQYIVLSYLKALWQIRIVQDFYGVNTSTTHVITRVAQDLDANGWKITLETGKGVQSAT